MIPRHRLGQTDLHCSRLGLGTVKFGRNQGVKYPTAFSLPEDDQLFDLLAIARELGVNLLDTAPAYGLSEERLGKLLGRQRQDWIICTKTGEEFGIDPTTNTVQSHFDFSAKHTRMSIERSLRRLNTDYLDIVLIHSNGSDTDILMQTPILATLETLKKEGWIRAFGISSKTRDGGVAAASLCDILMVTYAQDSDDDKAVLDNAHQHGRGILLKKVLDSGHICHDAASTENPLARAFAHAYAHPSHPSAIIGTLNPDHLRTNIRLACDALNAPYQ
jgi:aryl-alcohol dehydrogenase-like predicted oxidoreductase